MNKPIACAERVYTNAGNPPLLDLLEGPVRRVLDVGCGAGDNAVHIKQRYPDASVSGVTISVAEAAVARSLLDACWVFDIETDLPEALEHSKFDTLVFSHVLEHLKNPASVLARFVKLLQPRSQVLIAVPNVLNWRQRFQFFRGRFEYESGGVLDDTHLRFFTYYTAAPYLFADCSELVLTHQCATGSVPLWWLRRYLLPNEWCSAIDRFGSKHWPNLFGGQVNLRAIKL